MKNSIKQELNFLLLCFILAACSPQEMDNYSLSELNAISGDQLSFSQTASTTSQNVITFTNTSTLADKEYVVIWDLGNGTTSTGKAQSITGTYPYSGDYTVTMTVYNNNSSASKSEVIHIAENDFGLLDTPNYRALTGGAENVEGKTWVFDQYHSGHMGVGPAAAATPEWWSAPENGKEGSSLYTQKFTFYQSGTKMKWENNGYIYANAAGVNGMGNPAGVVENPGGAGDFDVPFVPGDNYTFSLDESAMTLTLSGNAFLGFYVGSSTYQILTLTEDELYVKVISETESGNGWWFRLIPEELNVAPPEVVREPKAIPLSENFEDSSLKINFAREEMGDRTGAVDNPMPLPINTSNKVYRYQKTGAFYSNISWVAPDYMFDLTTQHKIRMKVYIPSYNDYTTENNVDGPWVAENKLRPQVAVKLQNSEHAAPWETQSEIVKANLETDKWLQLEFDFVGVKDRTDFDKIVIQFGGEGHAGPGFFFFDDFSFTE
ncbi:MAG: PKD domain-containing protein [Bacteroidia bacterium]|nr:PKD domain-containing protein [Bacteroidia bacterium]